MDEWQSLRQAALAAGVDRNTVARWVRERLLPSRNGKVRHLQTTLVEVAKVRQLAAQRKPGRPRSQPSTKRTREGNVDASMRKTLRKAGLPLDEPGPATKRKRK